MDKYIKIIGESINHKGKNDVKSIDNLFTDEFFKRIEKKVSLYNNSSFYVNELYINFIQPFLAFKEFISELTFQEKITVDVTQGSERIQSFLIDLAKKNSNIKLKRSYSLQRYKIFLMNNLVLLATVAYLFIQMLKIKKTKDPLKEKSLYLVRTKSSIQKFNLLGLMPEIEDFKELQSSVYSYYSLATRLRWVFSSWIGAYAEWRTIDHLMRNYIGVNTANYTLNFFSKRLVHTLLYQKVCAQLIVDKKPQQFYTGNNLDRFSVVEENLCKQHGVELICIPHGLEYGFKFPKGFSGDIFYTSSVHAAQYLNRLYCETKFKFDSKLAKAIFSVGEKSRKLHNQPDIVFFTEPREPEVNHIIIKALLPQLKASNLILTLKLHPKDIKQDYEDYDVYIEQSLDVALQKNICFSRKSTTLLEATYNDSPAAAILINEKDKAIFNTFPSLQDDRIDKFFTIQDLYGWIFKHIKH